MGFIMPSWLRIFRKGFILVCLYFSLSGVVCSSVYSASVSNVNIETDNIWVILNADINYKLSPTAKRALDKGIALNWIVIIKVQKIGVFWDETVRELQIAYQIQNHALLNLYSVKRMENGETEVFTTLTAAFNYISKIRQLSLIERHSLAQDEDYFVAIKVLFNREALPVPLRPWSYFKSQWALSSQWSRWQLQN
jgi:hypothetical protein